MTAATRLSPHLPALAAALDTAMESAAGERVAFVLTLCTESDGVAHSVSNVCRRDATQMLMAQVGAWLSGTGHEGPAHENPVLAADEPQGPLQ